MDSSADFVKISSSDVNGEFKVSETLDDQLIVSDIGDRSISTENLFDLATDSDEIDPIQQYLKSIQFFSQPSIQTHQSLLSSSMEHKQPQQSRIFKKFTIWNIAVFLARLFLILIIPFCFGIYYYQEHYGLSSTSKNLTCHESIDELKLRLDNLHQLTSAEIYGQHIAVHGVLAALYAHVTDPTPPKSLVMSFHGWLGSGKTMLAGLIANSLFLDGLRSPYVKSFIGPRHFLHDTSKIRKSQIMLSEIVESTVKGCNRSLFIFDEVDKMPAEIFNVLVPFIGYQGIVDGVDYAQAIFIFLSNTGGIKINQRTLDHLNQKKSRVDLTLHDFREIIAEGAFNEEGGLFESEMITRKLVDHYIPFLPLEKQHVIQCIKKQMKRREVFFINPNEILPRLLFFPSHQPIFALEGCKNIAAQVAYHVHESENIFNI